MKRWELVAIIGVGAYEFETADMKQEELEVMRGKFEIGEGVRGTLDLGVLLCDPDWDAYYKEGFDACVDAYAAMNMLALKILDREARWFGYESGDFELWTLGNSQLSDESDKEYFARWAEEFEETLNNNTYSYLTAIIRNRETGEYDTYSIENPAVGYVALMDAYERAEESGRPWTW